MLRFSARMGGFIDYNIVFADGIWYAWFNIDLIEKLKVEANAELVAKKDGVKDVF